VNLAEQVALPFAALYLQAEGAPAPKGIVQKRTRLPWRKQHNLYAPPDPNDLRSTMARPLSQFNGRELSGNELAFMPQADAILEEFADDVPTTLADCQPGGKNEARPCPFVRCQFHTYVDVNEDGALKLNFPGMALDDPRIRYTCAIDAANDQAAKGPKAPPRDFVELGRLLNMTGAGSKKIIKQAEARMREEADAAGLEPSYDDGPTDCDSLMPAPLGDARGLFDAFRAAPETDRIHKPLSQRTRRK
jgi:hypothetical protein